MWRLLVKYAGEAGFDVEYSHVSREAVDAERERRIFLARNAKGKKGIEWTATIRDKSQ